MNNKQYHVQLLQHTWVHTETFTVEANNDKDAIEKAKALIKGKDIAEDYKLNPVLKVDETQTVDAPEPEER